MKCTCKHPNAVYGLDPNKPYCDSCKGSLTKQQYVECRAQMLRKIFNTKYIKKNCELFVTDKTGEIIYGCGHNDFMLMAFAMTNQREHNGRRCKLFQKTRKELSKTSRWYEEVK